MGAELVDEDGGATPGAADGGFRRTPHAGRHLCAALASPYSGGRVSSAAELAQLANALLRCRATPDYVPALNGLQVDNRAPIARIAAAVDCSQRTIRGAIDVGANMLVVHHGLFWGGLQPLTGTYLERVRVLLGHDVALYAAHLPLDAHESMGNSFLLARALGLEPEGGFARYQTIFCGVQGTSDVTTDALVSACDRFAREHGGRAIASPHPGGRRTRRWGVVTGAGITGDTLREAVDLGLDTVITGEGPHWSAIEAEEKGLVLVYAGHYATETLGVQALATWLAAHAGVPWNFVEAPTGL
ncbi:MAG: Nif3-like dinuclear metal center hexameric protein [Gemmatimonas sp.]|nr:Nif3-like dinuclear metal center hexameric protein [Gemmatimonas sp.]